MYYPNYYWVQQNHYPSPAEQKKAWLPWAVIFLLIMASFYTIYLYIQPEFIFQDVTCTQTYVTAHFIMAKSGRFFMGNFELDISGKVWEKTLTSTVVEGDTLSVVFRVALAPGQYSGNLKFRDAPTGEFNCTVN